MREITVIGDERGITVISDQVLQSVKWIEFVHGQHALHRRQIAVPQLLTSLYGGTSLPKMISILNLVNYFIWDDIFNIIEKI